MDMTKPVFELKGHNQFYRYWDSKRNGRFAPARSDIDPIEISNLLPNLYIYKVFRDPLDYQLTLVGTKIVEMMGADATGQMLGQVLEGRKGVEFIRPLFDRIVETGEYGYSDLSAQWVDRDYYIFHRLLLPLSDDGQKVNRIIGCAFFTLREDKDG